MGNLRAFACVFVCFFLCGLLNSQTSYTLNPSQKNVDCTKGAAGIEIQGVQSNDTMVVEWSTGQINVSSISELDAGNYSVHVTIKSKLDSTINYKIEKTECPVPIENHFTPNGDGYNDTWTISNTQYYPNFEVIVFNKWGQQIHSQSGDYKAWDGTWNGVNVPDGTYYYVFYFDKGNKTKLLKGDVTVLR